MSPEMVGWYWPNSLELALDLMTRLMILNMVLGVVVLLGEFNLKRG